MVQNNFDDTISTWIKALQSYSFATICVQPAPQSWSLGQLYLHLINDTHYYIEQIKTCLLSNENTLATMSATGAALFLQNGFPDKQIKGHPNNALIPQPAGKAQLASSLMDIKVTMNTMKALIDAATVNGKTLHDGFGYLDAAEWYQLADMHFRHHARQKQRIDDFLEGRRNQVKTH